MTFAVWACCQALRLLGLDDPGRVEEQRSPRISHTFPAAYDAERLVRQSCKQHAMVRHFVGVFDAVNITYRTTPQVSFGDSTRRLINVGSENTLHAEPGCSDMEAANSTEHVREHLQTAGCPRCSDQRIYRAGTQHIPVGTRVAPGPPDRSGRAR